MTGTITLVDGGQNYVEFSIACGVIEEVRPARLAGWRGTKILNTKLFPGNALKIDLQWKDYDLPLKYLIAKVEYLDVPGSVWLHENKSDEKKLYTNPVTYVDHEAYTVNCQGLPFYFDCVNLAAIAASNALLMTDKIPAVLLADVAWAQLVSEIFPGDPDTIACIKWSGLTIFGDRIIDYGIITHEASHAWAYDKWGQYNPPDDTDYVEVIRFSGEEPITEYAKTNYAEDLAEGTRYYVFDPPWMKEKCPLRYDIIERMMTDPGYYG